jgi:UPF0716 protein FxsA
MQGFAVLMQMQASLATGRMPTDELVEGAIVLFGGALLLTPGFMTDLFGLSCLVPISRKGYAALLQRWAAKRIQQVGPGRANVGGFRFWTGGVHPGSAGGPDHSNLGSNFEPPPQPTGHAETIDASFEVRGETGEDEED